MGELGWLGGGRGMGEGGGGGVCISNIRFCAQLGTGDGKPENSKLGNTMLCLTAPSKSQ